MSSHCSRYPKCGCSDFGGTLCQLPADHPDLLAAFLAYDKKQVIHLKLDRTTLPKDGQYISFQTQDEDWHDGYFVDGDDLFWINENKWYPAFDIVSWKIK